MIIKNKRRLLAIIIFLLFSIGISAWIYTGLPSSFVVNDASKDIDIIMEADPQFDVSEFSLHVDGFIDGEAKFHVGGNEEIFVRGNFSFARHTHFSDSSQRKKGVHYRPKDGATGKFVVKWKFE